MLRLVGIACVVVAVTSACGAPPPPRSSGYSIAPVIAPGGEPTTMRDLGAMPTNEKGAAICGEAPLLGVAPATCKRLAGQALTSGANTPASTEAFDGDACSIWQAGGPAPRFAAVDIGPKQVVTSVILIPEMSEKGHVKQIIESSDDGASYHTQYIVEGEMEPGHAYEVQVKQPFTAKVVRVSTMQSPTWVAWREILPLSCK